MIAHSALLATLSVAAVLASASADLGRAHAFSQITTEDGEPLPSREGIISVPLPPVTDTRPAEAGPQGTEPAAGEPDVAPPLVDDAAPGFPPSQGGSVPQPAGPGEAPGTGPAASPEEGTGQPAAEPLAIGYGDAGLPEPVRDLRSRLMEIAATGEIENLRPYLETGAAPTVVSPVGDGGDPVAFLKTSSGDGEGVEILAILLEILESGHVHLDAGSENEIFVWPYFTQAAIGGLTKPQLIELFEIVTAGDHQRMLADGHYDFYRVGISPEGRLEFFLAGD